MDRAPRTGWLIVMVAVGAGTVGYVLGRFQSTEGPPARPDARRAPVLERSIELPTERGDDLLRPEDPEVFVSGAKDEVADDDGEALPPSEYLEALREHAHTERSQQILRGMIADAARVGSAALPEIKRLLESGVDIQFASAKDGSFPSLRVALMEAAAATGDPDAAELVAQVALTTESPVEVVFSAHVLDKLNALDATTAQRTLDSLATQLTKEERKAMASVVGKVVPAAAAADAEYAETYLATHLRTQPEGTPQADPRLIAPALHGLNEERAREVMLTLLNAGDVSDRAKATLARTAAQRQELGLLVELRQAIESNALPPKVASSVASSSMSGRPFSRLNKQARVALKQGNVDAARQAAAQYHQRLNEARRTVTAARTAGAKVSRRVDTTARLHEQTLQSLRVQIVKVIKRQEQKAKASQSK